MADTDRENILELVRAVSRIETKLDSRIGMTDDHEKRLRGLERHKWLQVGAATVVSSCVAVGAAFAGLFQA